MLGMTTIVGVFSKDRTAERDYRPFSYPGFSDVRHPGFTVTAVGVLTLGIGVNAGVFGIINGLMIRPLGGADAPGECSDPSDQPARSGDSGSRQRNSCDLVARGVNHSGSTGCWRSPDDCAQKQLTPQF